MYDRAVRGLGETTAGVQIPRSAALVANLFERGGPGERDIEPVSGDWNSQDVLLRPAKRGRTDEAELPNLRFAYLRDEPLFTDFGLAKLLDMQGRTDELRAEVDAGTPHAAEHLTDLLARAGETGQAERMRRFGLNLDGSIADPGRSTPDCSS